MENIFVLIWWTSLNLQPFDSLTWPSHLVENYLCPRFMRCSFVCFPKLKPSWDKKGMNNAKKDQLRRLWLPFCSQNFIQCQAVLVLGTSLHPRCWDGLLEKLVERSSRMYVCVGAISIMSWHDLNLFHIRKRWQLHVSDWSNATETSGFWFGELSFHHVVPPETFVLGFCVPESCCRDCSVIQASSFLGNRSLHWYAIFLWQWPPRLSQYVVLGDL